jgi:hypothetical protein
VRFSSIAAAGGNFNAADIHAPALDPLSQTDVPYALASFRYDLFEHRAKGPVEKVPVGRRYRLARSFSICLVFLQLWKTSTHHLPLRLMALFSGIRVLAEENAASFTAYTSASETPSTHSCGRSVSTSQHDSRHWNKILVNTHITGIKHKNQAQKSGLFPLSFHLPVTHATSRTSICRLFQSLYRVNRRSSRVCVFVW